VVLDGAVLLFGGLLASGRSCVLLAELAVGRIILAKNPSLTGLELWSLVRELGRSCAGCAAREGRDDCLRTLEVADPRAGGALTALLRDDGLRVRVEAVVVVRPFEGPTAPNLPEDDAVDAVAEDGSRAGLVGDFDRGLLLGAVVVDVLGPS
jgi:hypothetical protein